MKSRNDTAYPACTEASPEFTWSFKEKLPSDAKYLIIFSKRTVLALSKRNIPYGGETKKGAWLMGFHRALKEKLGQLESPDEAEKGLAAYYYQENQKADLENILFYNVGTSCFRELAGKRLSAVCGKAAFDAALKRANLPEIEGMENFPYRYLYRVCDSGPMPVPKPPAAQWGPLPIAWRPSGDQKPVHYWKVLKQQMDAGGMGELPIGGDFGVHITLFVPEQETVNLASAVKPLLDGVICAFHDPDDEVKTNAEEIAERILAAQYQHFGELTPEKLKTWLASGGGNPLGPRNFVYLYGEKGVKWNPADDLCTAFELTVQPSRGGGFSFSGSLYPLEETPAGKGE